MSIMKKFSVQVFSVSEKGQALITVLMFLMVGTLVITPLLYMAITVSHSVLINGKSLEGFYAADAGFQRALWDLRMGDRYADTFSLPEYTDNMTVNVGTSVPTNEPGSEEYIYIITSTATDRNGKRICTVTANVTVIQNVPPPPPSTSPYGISFSFKQN
jgi:hypothetical protein